MLGMSAWGSRRNGPMSSQIPGKFYNTGTLGLQQPLIKVLELAQNNPVTAEIHQETTPPPFPS